MHYPVFEHQDTLSIAFVVCIILYIGGKQFRCSVFTFDQYIKLTLCVIGSGELKRVNPDQPAPQEVVTMFNFQTLNFTQFIKFWKELMLKI